MGSYDTSRYSVVYACKVHDEDVDDYQNGYL